MADRAATALKLDDSRWAELTGGRGVPYDPRPAFKRIELDTDPDSAWQELWDNLLDDGVVGEASYAAIPRLVEIVDARRERPWNFFLLAGTIELERESPGNPELPAWLAESYATAWEKLFDLARDELAAARDPLTLRCLLATIAIAKGDLLRGRLLMDHDDDELEEMLGEFSLGHDCED